MRRIIPAAVRAWAIFAVVALLAGWCVAAFAAAPPAPGAPGEVWDMPESSGHVARLRDVPPAPAAQEYDGDAIAAAATACSPEPGGSWIRPEVALTVSQDTSDKAGRNQYWAGVTASLPLYSHAEVEKEREKSYQRRVQVAELVGKYLNARGVAQRGARELALWDADETRSRARVSSGVASSSEQEAAADKAIMARERVEGARADMMAARLALLAPCDDAGRAAVEAALRRAR